MVQLAPITGLREPSLLNMCPIMDAVRALSTAGAESRGAIFTRREVVEFILDLVDYRADRPLHERRLLEPCFGAGDFLLPAIERLLLAWRASDRPNAPNSLERAICAVELHRPTFIDTKAKVIALLCENGIAKASAQALADGWLVHCDFLLTELNEPFDFVVGNPPYVRQELIPDVLMSEYRSRYETIYDRADLYVPFIERSLKLLGNAGLLGFICADRWMKNRYGGPLRAMVSNSFRLKAYIDMVGTSAFHSDVIAYPAITIIERSKSGPTRIAHRPDIEHEALSALSKSLLAKAPPNWTENVREIPAIRAGSEPWLLEVSDELELVRRLERDFPALEETGCKVGIGVATGDDSSFIGQLDELDVEDDRKLPLVMTRDIQSGIVRWRGFGVVNPFTDEGGLVDLATYPRLRRYLEARKDKIAKRHVAQKTPSNWYRTIDRIYPALAEKPKLLIPDIKGRAHIVYEGGNFYPHHNLYFITSESWDLRALQAVLMSGIARLFVSAYSTKMHGGFLRFQAQYLRRIRLPSWEAVPPEIRRNLIDAAMLGDIAGCNFATFELYRLSEAERDALMEVKSNAA